MVARKLPGLTDEGKRAQLGNRTRMSRFVPTAVVGP
jgi:hypothetical protein